MVLIQDLSMPLYVIRLPLFIKMWEFYYIITVLLNRDDFRILCDSIVSDRRSNLEQMIETTIFA
ncbi:hypothetical protein YSY22_51100 [Brevibacillus formosus]